MKKITGQIGFFGVLHTWGRDPLVYHPHIHYVVPSGGVKLDADGRAVGWQSTPKNFLFHHGTLIRVYKAKLADQLRAAGQRPCSPATTTHHATAMYPVWWLDARGRGDLRGDRFPL